MTDLILTVRSVPDADADVAALRRRGVPAMVAPVMTAICPDDIVLPAAGSVGGLIFTSRHAIAGFLALCGGVVPPEWCRLPVFAVGRASGRVARAAGFTDVSDLLGGYGAWTAAGRQGAPGGLTWARPAELRGRRSRRR